MLTGSIDKVLEGIGSSRLQTALPTYDHIMWLPEDVLGAAAQEAIYDRAAALHTEVSSRVVSSRAVEMASKVVPRYMQHFLGWLAASTAAAPFVSVPSSVPANASGIVDPDFAGFAFEQASLWNYALDLDGNPNAFSQNLIAEITNRTGGTALIRIGGTR